MTQTDRKDRGSRVDEFELIRRVTARLPQPGKDVLVGIGDDAAVVQTDAAKLLITTDTMVEGVHFLPSTITNHNLGYKSLAVSISDIAAMGGWPVCATISIAIPANWGADKLTAIYDGLAEASVQFECDLVGGDVVSTAGPMVLTTTVIGKAHSPILRSGAQPGDILFVSGWLGGSKAGLEVLEQASATSPIGQAVLARRHQRPEPRLAIGRIAAEYGVHALNDISDGLASELNELATASGIRCVIDADQIPILPEVKEQARARQVDPLDYALYGGEDYELVGAASRQAFANLLAASSGTRVPVTAIGRCDTGDGVVMRRGDHLEVIAAKGYNHLR